MSVAYAAFLDQVTDGFEPGADTRAQARTIIDRMLDGSPDDQPQPLSLAEEEEVRQNQAALAGLAGMLSGLQVPGKR